MSGAIQLERAGIFKAKPFDWSVQPSNSSKSVAICVGLLITAQYENGEWVSWEEYEPHQTRGWWYVIGKNGQVNTAAVEQLVKSLGWNGDLKAVANTDVPDVVVQVSVKGEEYQGKTNYKAKWMNPEDFSPEGFGASDEDVSKLSVQFGSLLRAAAASAKKATPAKPAAKKAEPAKATGTDDDVPF